ncbi:MAG: hypothetical protein ACYCW6_27440 [Candidatus Xenobia bacterium]
MKKISLSVPDDVAEWLKAQPDGGGACVTDAVRRRKAGREALEANVGSILAEAGKRLADTLWEPLAEPSAASPVKAPSASSAPGDGRKAANQAAAANAEVQAALKILEARDPAIARRAEALSRYPQLVDVVARGLITIDRAEEMAEEADARARR